MHMYVQYIVGCYHNIDKQLAILAGAYEPLYHILCIYTYLQYATKVFVSWPYGYRYGALPSLGH